MKLLQIENRVGKVKLNDAVTPWSADDLIADIEKAYGNQAVAENLTIGGFQCAASDALETLDIEINSPGGSVMDGYRIYNSLQQMRARGVRVVATVNTIAASMGSVILMAADEIRIVEGGRIMIHEASQAIAGDSASHARAAKILDEISAEIAAIYASRTGATPEEMRTLMKAETWMGAQESLDRKFADSIVKFDTKPKGMSILAKLFPGNDEVSKLEASIVENDSIRAELAEAQSKISELTALAEVNSQLQSELSAAQVTTSELAAKVAEYDVKVAELTAAVEVTAEKVSVRAAELLAASGHPAPVAASAEPQHTSTQTLFQQYRELQKADPTAASKFWDEHESDIANGL